MVIKIFCRIILRVGGKFIIIQLALMLPMHAEDVSLPHKPESLIAQLVVVLRIEWNAIAILTDYSRFYLLAQTPAGPMQWHVKNPTCQLRDACPCSYSL